MKKSMSFSIAFKEENNSSIISISHLLLQVVVEIGNLNKKNSNIKDFEKEIQLYLTNLKFYNETDKKQHTKETLLIYINNYIKRIIRKYDLLLCTVRLYNTNSITHEYLEI